jgi:hypothetical protein
MSQAELQPNHEKLPGIIIATEPLNRYRPFLTNAQLYGPYAEAYVRWRTVESGGAKSLEDTTDTGEPTGWDGYLAGFKPDEQAEIKSRLKLDYKKDEKNENKRGYFVSPFRFATGGIDLRDCFFRDSNGYRVPFNLKDYKLNNWLFIDLSSKIFLPDEKYLYSEFRSIRKNRKNSE